MKRVAILVPHPDDEALFMGRWFLDESFEKRVLACSDDSKNPSRAWCCKQSEAFAASCTLMGAERFEQIPYFSEFYKLRTRGKGDGPLLMDWWNDTLKSLHELVDGWADLIATTSPDGNYGHLDHILCHRLAVENFNIPVGWQDSFHRTTTWPIGEKLPRHNLGMPHTLDKEAFEQVKKCYTDRGCWTWDNPVQEVVRVTIREKP